MIWPDIDCMSFVPDRQTYPGKSAVNAWHKNLNFPWVETIILTCWLAHVFETSWTILFLSRIIFAHSPIVRSTPGAFSWAKRQFSPREQKPPQWGQTTNRHGNEQSPSLKQNHLSTAYRVCSAKVCLQDVAVPSLVESHHTSHCSWCSSDTYGALHLLWGYRFCWLIPRQRQEKRKDSTYKNPGTKDPTNFSGMPCEVFGMIGILCANSRETWWHRDSPACWSGHPSIDKSTI